MSMKDIVKGHMKELLNSEEELYNERISICKSCPLYKFTLVGPICNSDLYLNKETGDVSTIEKHNYVRGCGCRLNAKTRIPEASCPTDKW